MAVYRCEVKTLKRASGRSAVAAAAYRAADRLRDEQAGKAHDYRRRGPGVAYAEILTPSGAPEWATKRGRLWNEAERAENRRNSVTAREVLLSLPHELDDQQRAELARGFASRLVERYGVAVDLAIHRPDRKGDQRNHHAHLMMTTRRMNREGFTEKTRELDDMKKRGPEEIEAIRELWEREQNQALQRAAKVERVSRLSNKAQGLDREPEPKIGEAANALMRRGQPTKLGERVQEIRKRNTMRENMARQRSGKLDREKQEAMRRALEAAARQQRAAQNGPAHIAEALMRDTSETRRGEQEAERLKKDEARKLDEERQRAAELEATRAWERQRQAELRKRREATEQQNQNPNDLGRVMTPPPPSPDK